MSSPCLKKSALFILILLLPAPLLVADIEVVVGARKGLNIAGQYGYPTGERESRSIFGFAGGVYGAFAITDAFYCAPEILFSIKGRHDQGADISERLFISYLDFPLLLGFKFDLWKITLGLYGGPQFAVPVSAARRVDQKGKTPRIDHIDDELTAADAGVVVGWELGIPIRSSVITLDARYNLGFLEALDQGKPRNSVFSFLLGYGFSLF